MGWTGGQYSLWRVALAIAVVCALWTAMPAGNFVLLAFALPLAIGWHDRVAACALAFAVLPFEIIAHDTPFPFFAVGWAGVLILHASVPRAPFGSFEARGRIDPRGGWRRPQGQISVFWGLLAVVAVGRLIAFGDSGPFDTPTLGRVGHAVELIAALVGLASTRARPRIWIALALWRIAWLFAFGPDALDGLSLVLLFGAADPGWWSGRSLRLPVALMSSEGATRTPAHLFYDGDCGFCHRSVRFILSEELATPELLRLRFAPLGSATCRERMAHHPELDPASLPDSIVLELEDGTILMRSAAALEIASRLGGFWRLLALIGSRLPSRLLDAGYDAIARVRKRLFATPKDACPILPLELRARFDP